MKKLFTKIFMVAMAMVIGLSVFSGCKTGEDLSGYVALDINPSIEFITDKNGKVAEVRAVNDDAKVLLVDMNLKNLDISVAIEMVTEEAEKCGYISNNNTDVSITISGNTEKAEARLKELAEKSVQKGSAIAQIAHDAIHDALNEQVEALKAKDAQFYEGLTVAKLKVINSIMEYDRTLTLEELVNKDMDDLVVILKGYFNQFADFFDDELEIKFKEKLNELSAEIYAQIDTLIGDVAVQAKMAMLRKLEILEEKFEQELENVRPEGELHFSFGRDFEDDDEDAEILTADMKAQLKLVINDQTVVDAIVTIDDLDDYIDNLEDEVEDAYENLSNQVKEQIEQLKVQIKALENVAREFVKELAKTVKVQLKVQKDMLKLPFGAGNN